jgi:hypothetical protein
MIAAVFDRLMNDAAVGLRSENLDDVIESDW